MGSCSRQEGLGRVVVRGPALRHARVRVLLRELEQYNPELLEKDRILSISKCDVLDAELREEVSAELGELDHHYFSAVTGEGLDRLKDQIWRAITGGVS